MPRLKEVLEGFMEEKGGRRPPFSHPPVKLCLSYGEFKAVSEFQRRKYGKDGRTALCKTCEQPAW